MGSTHALAIFVAPGKADDRSLHAARFQYGVALNTARLAATVGIGAIRGGPGIGGTCSFSPSASASCVCLPRPAA